MRKSRIKYSDKIADFICEKVAEGLTVADICDRLFKDSLPPSTSVYRWQNEHPDFDKKLTVAYVSHFMRKYEELEYITRATLAELFPDISDQRERFEARRTRVDTLKFSLGKLAPVLTNRFKTTQTLEVEHKGNQPLFQILNFELPNLLNNNIIEHDKLDN